MWDRQLKGMYLFSFEKRQYDDDHQGWYATKTHDKFPLFFLQLLENTQISDCEMWLLVMQEYRFIDNTVERSLKSN